MYEPDTREIIPKPMDWIKAVIALVYSEEGGLFLYMPSGSPPVKGLIYFVCKPWWISFLRIMVFTSVNKILYKFGPLSHISSAQGTHSSSE